MRKLKNFKRNFKKLDREEKTDTIVIIASFTVVPVLLVVLCSLCSASGVVCV